MTLDAETINKSVFNSMRYEIEELKRENIRLKKKADSYDRIGKLYITQIRFWRFTAEVFKSLGLPSVWASHRWVKAVHGMKLSSQI